MSDQPRVLSLNSKITPELPLYVILENGEKVPVRADTFASLADEEGNAIQVILYKKGKPVAQFPGHLVKAVLSAEAVDVDAAVAAMNKRRRRATR